MATRPEDLTQQQQPTPSGWQKFLDTVTKIEAQPQAPVESKYPRIVRARRDHDRKSDER